MLVEAGQEEDDHDLELMCLRFHHVLCSKQSKDGARKSTKLLLDQENLLSTQNVFGEDLDVKETSFQIVLG